MRFWDEKEAKWLFQKVPFYNVSIEEPKIRGLKNRFSLIASFYNELGVYEISKVFEWYSKNYKVEILDSKDSLPQLEASKSNIKDLCRYLLDKIMGFRYKIPVKVLLRKDKQNGGIEFTPAYFNSITKTVINFKYDLDKSFQEVLYRI